MMRCAACWTRSIDLIPNVRSIWPDLRICSDGLHTPTSMSVLKKRG